MVPQEGYLKDTGRTVEVSSFPVGLPPLKKASTKKKCQKGTPPGGGGGVPFWVFLSVFGVLGNGK